MNVTMVTTYQELFGGLIVDLLFLQESDLNYKSLELVFHMKLGASTL